MRPSAQLSQEELRRLRSILEREEKGKDPEEVLLDNAEFQRRIRITRRTAYNWRRKNLIKFLFIQKKVFYRLSEIRKFLDTQSVT